MYFFDAATGAVYRPGEKLPAKKGRLYLVIGRDQLYFRNFSIKSGKRVKDTDMLNLQGHFIPFKEPYLNLIYTMEKKEEKKFFFWVGDAVVDVESAFYDEIPESLIFKGDPAAVKKYGLFVFQRLNGYEIIHFDGEEFYSLFHKEREHILEALIALVRKFSLRGRVKVLTEVSIPAGPEGAGAYALDIDLMRSSRENNGGGYFFLPAHYPVKKKYSNISRDKQLKNIKNMIRQWSRNLNIILFLLLVVVLVNAAGLVYLKKDNRDLQERFAAIQDTVDASDALEFRFNRIREKAAAYPDHLLYLDTVAQALGEDGVLLTYTLEEGHIVIEGFSVNSIEILEQLRKSNHFKNVQFKSTVTKNVHNQREKFEIEMVPGEPGSQPGEEGQ